MKKVLTIVLLLGFLVAVVVSQPMSGPYPYPFNVWQTTINGNSQALTNVSSIQLSGNGGTNVFIENTSNGDLILTNRANSTFKLLSNGNITVSSNIVFSTGPQIIIGVGSPEGVVSGSSNCLYIRTDASGFYLHTNTGNTGWYDLLLRTHG